MGGQTGLVDSNESGSDNESSDVESEEAFEEEEPSEEEPVDEHPCEEEPIEEDSCEDLNEEDSCEEEPDEEDSCEEEPDEEIQCTEEPEEVSCEDEPNEGNSCESQNEETSGDELKEEPFEGDSYADEEECVQELAEEEECEEELAEEEECEEEPSEEEPCEEESGEESEEEPSEGEPSEGSGAHKSFNSDNNEDPIQCKSGKKVILADTVSDFKEIPGPSGINVLETPRDVANSITVPEKLDSGGSSGKKRQSRWDIKPGTGINGETAAGGDVATKKRKTRWSNDDSQCNMQASLPLCDFVSDPEFDRLSAQLREINKKLQDLDAVAEQQENGMPSSPLTIQDNVGAKINRKMVRHRGKLMFQKRGIIAKLTHMHPNFEPPVEAKKFCKKLYVPAKEYPEYNFIGLIIGPRGNTVRKMQKETGARIRLRGKGSIKEGKDHDPVPSDYEDLHVLIEAEDQVSLDVAVGMVEKLLIPKEDGCNVHKLAQLRELAELNGTLRNNFTKAEPCNVCGDKGHPTSSCPLTASARGTNPNGPQANFLAELGCGLSPFSGPALPSVMPSSVVNPLADRSKPNNEIDESRLFVGCLPNTIDDNKLIQLFLPFGQLCDAKVARDRSTGFTKGYGFIRYNDSSNAAKAVAKMNGFHVDGSKLVVRTAGTFPANSNTGSGGLPSLNHLPNYLGPAAIVQNNPGSVCWPGPPGSLLPSLPNGNILPMHTNAFSGQAPAPFGPPCQTSGTSSLFSGDMEFASFPGYQKSLDPPHQLYQQSMPLNSLPPSQVPFARTTGSHLMPPP